MRVLYEFCRGQINLHKKPAEQTKTILAGPLTTSQSSALDDEYGGWVRINKVDIRK